MIHINLIYLYNDIREKQVKFWYNLHSRQISEHKSHELCTHFTLLSFVVVLYLVLVKFIYISFRVTSLALGQSHDCPSASEVTLKDIGKTGHYHITTKCKQSMNHAQNFWDVSHRVHLNILLIVINETKTMKYRHNYCIQSTHNIDSSTHTFAQCLRQAACLSVWLHRGLPVRQLLAFRKMLVFPRLTWVHIMHWKKLRGHWGHSYPPIYI